MLIFIVKQIFSTDLFNRFSPPSMDNTTYTLMNHRLNKIRSTLLYPFHDKGGPENIGDHQKDLHWSIAQIHKTLPFNLPFFGFTYNYTRVSLNGFLEFSDPPPHYTYPLSFPIREWPKKNDPAFIGIFYSKCRIGALTYRDIDRRDPGLYFR